MSELRLVLTRKGISAFKYPELSFQNFILCQTTQKCIIHIRLCYTHVGVCVFVWICFGDAK